MNHRGLKTPVIHHVCADKLVWGGVFADMDLVPGQPLMEQKPELHAKVLGQSMATMHELDVRPIGGSFRRACVPDEVFLSPVIDQHSLAVCVPKIVGAW